MGHIHLSRGINGGVVMGVGRPGVGKESVKVE